MRLRATRVLFASLLLAATVGGCKAAHKPAGGPLVAPAPHGFVMTQPVGFVFTDGVETLELGGDKPAVLKKVESVGTDGLEVLGVSLVKPGRKVGTIQAIDGWPPRDPYLRPSDVVTRGIGATFTPSDQNKQGQSYELLVGMKVVKAGYLVRDGYRITYEVGGTTYQRFFPAQLVVCTSKSMEKGHQGCPIPGDAQSR